MGQLQAPLCPPPRPCQTDSCWLTPAPLHCRPRDTARGAHTTGVGLSMAWVAGSPPGCTPLFFLLFFFLFFNLMLLWGLSCLYENKNNLRASAGAQPLPKALPTPGGSAQPTTPQNDQGQGLCLSQGGGGSLHSSCPRQGFVPTAGSTWIEQPPADDTHQPTPHVPLCSPWAPLSLPAPQPHPGAPCAVPSHCPRCVHEP